LVFHPPRDLPIACLPFFPRPKGVRVHFY
jgi:hypothetical protein